MLKIKNNLIFVSFHCGNKCSIKPLSSNGMTVINLVSRLEVALKILNSLTVSKNQIVIIDQVKSMISLTYVGAKNIHQKQSLGHSNIFLFQGPFTLDLEMITSFQA